jgi:hypothetical protein
MPFCSELTVVDHSEFAIFGRHKVTKKKFDGYQQKYHYLIANVIDKAVCNTVQCRGRSTRNVPNKL